MHSTLKLKKPFSKYTKEEILNNISENDGCCYFEISYDWQYCGTQNLNECIDEYVEKGYYLMDVSYTPLRIEGEEIIIEVCIGDTTEYVDEDFD